MIRKKRLIMFLLISCNLFLGAYILRQLLTVSRNNNAKENGIYSTSIDEFEDLKIYFSNYLLTEIPEGETINALERYNLSTFLREWALKFEDIAITLEIKEMYSVHDENDGYLWINFNREIADKTTDKTINSFSTVDRFTIKKEENRWLIIERDTIPYEGSLLSYLKK